MSNAPTTQAVSQVVDLSVKTRRPVPTWVVILLGVVAVAVAVTILFLDPGKLNVGILSVILMLLLLALGVPIGVAMIGASAIGAIGLLKYDVAATLVELATYNSVASWTLNVIPLFVLMGIMMWKGGITGKAYTAARHWLSWMPGGLAVSTNVAGAVLATTSGSTMGITFALTRMSLPEMLRAGYKPTIATGAVAMAGTLGQVIPPSILLVIYAGVASVPVGPQLLAGIVPGIMLALAFTLTIIVWATVRPGVAPRGPRGEFTWNGRLRSVVGLIPIVLVVVIVVGGMYSGVFTASEAAAVGVLAAFIVSWVSFGKGNRGARSTFTFLRSSVMDTVVSVAGLFIIIIGATMLARILTLSGVAQALTKFMLSLELDRVGLLLALILVYIFLGMFLESLPMILLTVPLLQAPLEALGVDMIWFGVFLVIMCEIGMVFPPIGLLTFIVHRLAQNPDVNVGHKVTLTDVFKGIMPFVAMAIVVTIVLIYFPDIVFWFQPAG